MRHGNSKIKYLQESFFSKQALFPIYTYPFLYSYFYFFHFCLQKKSYLECCICEDTLLRSKIDLDEMAIKG